MNPLAEPLGKLIRWILDAWFQGTMGRFCICLLGLGGTLVVPGALELLLRAVGFPLPDNLEVAQFYLGAGVIVTAIVLRVWVYKFSRQGPRPTFFQVHELWKSPPTLPDTYEAGTYEDAHNIADKTSDLYFNEGFDLERFRGLYGTILCDYYGKLRRHGRSDPKGDWITDRMRKFAEELGCE